MNRRSVDYLLLNNDGKTLLGFAMTGQPKKGRHRVMLIGTKPGQGHGKTLMNAIYANAKKEGATHVNVLNVVNDAQNFYRRMGYEHVSDSESENFQKFRRSVSPATGKRKRNRSASASPTSKRRKSP
jgi:N-acetylglutamate synthase-like GNAT family acetyltransferase